MTNGPHARAATTDADEAVVVEPALVDVEVVPGIRRSVELRVLNQTRDAVRAHVTIEDLQPGSSVNEPARGVPAGTARGSRGAGEWISVDEQVTTLAAATERSIRLVVEPPRGIASGGSYAQVRLRFEPVQRPTGGEIVVDEELVVPVLLRNRRGERRALRARVVDVPSVTWRGGRTSWTLRLANDGNIHELVGGSVSVDPWIGPTQRVDVDPTILLPGTTKSVRIRTDLRAAPNLVTVRPALETEDGERVDGGEGSRIIVLPWWILAVSTVVVLVAWWRWRRRSVVDEGWDDPDGDAAL